MLTKRPTYLELSVNFDSVGSFHLLNFSLVRYEVLKAASMKMPVFCVAALCSLVEVKRRFRGACCRYDWGDRLREWTESEVAWFTAVSWQWNKFMAFRFTTGETVWCNKFQVNRQNSLTCCLPITLTFYSAKWEKQRNWFMFLFVGNLQC
jgi:hypothetical protein